MTADASISIALLISVVSIVCTVINTTSGERKRGRDLIEVENSRRLETEKNFVKINVKLDEFHDTTRKILAAGEKKDEQIKKLMEKAAVTDERIKTLFNKTEDHEQRIHNLENERG